MTGRIGATAALVALLLAGCLPAAAPRVGPNDDLPAGATVVYYRTAAAADGFDVRVIHVDECYLTEIVEHGRWQLLNRAFVGSDPAVACGRDAEPVAP